MANKPNLGLIGVDIWLIYQFFKVSRINRKKTLFLHQWPFGEVVHGGSPKRYFPNAESPGLADNLFRYLGARLVTFAGLLASFFGPATITVWDDYHMARKKLGS